MMRLFYEKERAGCAIISPGAQHTIPVRGNGPSMARRFLPQKVVLQQAANLFQGPFIL
jgi:hypothetical protein